MKRFLIIIMALSIVIGACATLPASAVEGTAPAAENTAPAEHEDPYPQVVSITPDTTGFTVKWEAYPNAVKYRLFVKGASGWNRVGDTAGTALRHASLKDMTRYTYTVRALDAAGKYISVHNAAGWSSVFRSAPKLIAAVPCGNAVKITWQRIAGAGCYRVYRRGASGWVGVGFADGASYMDTAVTSGKQYTYTVRAFDGDRTTILSAYQSPGLSVKHVAMPSITHIESRNAGLRITWNKVAGAAEYRVFVKAVNGWKWIGDTTDTYYDYAIKPAGVAATYTVRALDGDGDYISDFSRTGRTHTYLAAPKLISVTNVNGGQTLSWRRVVGSRLYRIYILSGGTWKKLVDTADTSYTNRNTKNNTAYTYTVRCLSEDGRAFLSGFEPGGLTARYFDTPVISSVESTRSGALIKWKAIPGVAKYRIFAKSGSSWKAIADSAKASYTYKNAVQGTTYTYTVRALDASGRYISSFIAAGYPALYQTAPLLTNVAPAPEGTILSWKGYGDAVRCRVFRRTVDTQWSRIADVDGTTYTDTAAPEGVPVQYTLRALDAQGNLISDYYDNRLFYRDGVVADGTIAIKGYLCTFSKGRLTKGYVTPQDILRIAEAEVGTRATNYKNCKYNTWYYGTAVSGEDYAWCVVFVEWVFAKAGASELMLGKTAGCELLGTQFYEKGQIVKSGYRVGDLVLLHWIDLPSDYVPGVKRLNHVGIVKSVNKDGSVTLIEGNTGDDPNGEVMIKVRYPEQISCACRPKYGFYIPEKKAK